MQSVCLDYNPKVMNGSRSESTYVTHNQSNFVFGCIASCGAHGRLKRPLVFASPISSALDASPRSLEAPESSSWRNHHLLPTKTRIGENDTLQAGNIIMEE